MNSDTDKKKEIPGFMIVILLLLIIVAIHFGKQYFISYHHPYKDSEIVGTWDYSYSVTFDANDEWQRADDERFDLDMYIDTELVFNDNGSFTMSIEGVNFVGTWVPDENLSYLFYLTPESPAYDELVYYNTVRYDRTEDLLFFGIEKGNAPEELLILFEDSEVYREIYYKTYRERTRIVYRDGGDDYDEDEWDDDGDNGLPFNYHP